MKSTKVFQRAAAVTKKNRVKSTMATSLKKECSGMVYVRTLHFHERSETQVCTKKTPISTRQKQVSIKIGHSLLTGPTHKNDIIGLPLLWRNAEKTTTIMSIKNPTASIRRNPFVVNIGHVALVQPTKTERVQFKSQVDAGM